jgi:AraC family transcriptional regulator
VTEARAIDPLTTALAAKASAGRAGSVSGAVLAAGEGWRAIDVVCTCGPEDAPFEERHEAASVSLVLAGTFVSRSAHGDLLLAPGSLFLGSPGQAYECSHRHGEGDRCLSFQFDPDAFVELARDAGAARGDFACSGLPPLKALAALTARARAALHRPADLEEIAYGMAGAALSASCQRRSGVPSATPRHLARVAEVLRLLEAHSGDQHTLAELARMAGISPYHFLRTFKHVTGVTPHQWLLRARLQAAALRLVASRERITDIALDVGFEDLSNFARSFRAEFGVSPRGYRAAA